MNKNEENKDMGAFIKFLKGRQDEIYSNIKKVRGYLPARDYQGCLAMYEGQRIEINCQLLHLKNMGYTI